MAASDTTSPTQWPPSLIALRALMALAAASFAVASVVHFGVTITLGPVEIHDPFAGAAIPEGVIAVVLAIGLAASTIRWPMGWSLGVGTTLFALILTAYGLSVTIGTSRTGDVVYHVSILTVLIVILGLLLFSSARRGSG